MGAITLVSGLWLLLTPIIEAADNSGQTQTVRKSLLSSVAKTLGLLGDKTILLLFFGIFFAVGTDVSTNFLSSKVMISRFAYTKEAAGMAPQVYFVCRTIGAFIGMFLMARMSDVKYFRLNIVCCLVFALALAFICHPVLNFICIGGIGFCCSGVFPIVYGLALKSRPGKGNEISGLMIMAVAGGTVSFLVGAANEQAGIMGGALVIACEITYLTYLAFGVKAENTSDAEKHNIY